MFTRLATLAQLVWGAAARELRPLFVIVLIMATLGIFIALAATYPALAPFVYSLF